MIELLQKGAIQKIPFTRDGFYSRLFLAPKKGGSMRPVIALSSLNKFIVNEHFQMENLSCLKTLLLPGDFMANIDLKDSYLSVFFHETSRKFHRFVWKGTSYQFKALPFGLCSAPRIWWPVLLRLQIFQPVLLPNSPTLLTDPTDLNRVHPMYPRLYLAVFHISTNVSKLRAFRQTLPIYSSQQLAPPHTKPTSLVGSVPRKQRTGTRRE